MRISRFVASGAAVLLGLSTVAFAQHGHGGAMGPGAGTMGGHYDAAAEVSITGTIDEMTIMRPNGPGGMHLQLVTDAGLVEVHLGPAAFITEKHMELVVEDLITVIGSKGQMGGRDVVIAREISKGGQSVTLRDNNGVPLWSADGAAADFPCGCPASAGPTTGS